MGIIFLGWIEKYDVWPSTFLPFPQYQENPICGLNFKLYTQFLIYTLFLPSYLGRVW